MKKYKKVFLSIKNVSKEDLDKLVEQLTSLGCEVRISDLADELEILMELEQDEQYISDEIEWCDLVFVVIGPSKEEDVCVNREIEEASNQDKTVVGIYAGGDEECVPSALENVGDGLITNDIEKIAAVIDGTPPIWEAPEGGARKKKNKIDTGNC